MQAEIAAHTPALPPSFEALKARRRASDRRRIGASVVVSALAVAGIAFVPGAFRSDEGKAPAQVAQPGGEVFGFLIKAAYRGKDLSDRVALQRCLNMPGTSQVAVLYSFPAQYSGRVAGRDNADALKDCVETVPGWDVTLTPVANVSPVPSASAAWPTCTSSGVELPVGTLRSNPAGGGGLVGCSSIAWHAPSADVAASSVAILTRPQCFGERAVVRESLTKVEIAVVTVTLSGVHSCPMIPSGSVRLEVALKHPLGRRVLVHAPVIPAS